MLYKTAVCDDNGADAKYIASLVSEWAKASGAIARIDIFPSAEAFLFHYAENKDYDLLLLDIEMKKMDGVTLAKEVRKHNQSVPIVFITGYSDYIAEGYEVSALHYLMKPLHREKFFAVLDRAAAKLRRNERVLLLEVSKETVRLPLYEIRYLEVRQNYVTVHAAQDYTAKKALGEIEKELDDSFFRTGRSYIINLACIRRVTKTDVYLSDGSAVPLPRGMYEPLNRAIIRRT